MNESTKMGTVPWSAELHRDKCLAVKMAHNDVLIINENP